jgi:hypothetical protein
LIYILTDSITYLALGSTIEGRLLYLLLIHHVVGCADILTEVKALILLFSGEDLGVTGHDLIPGLGNCLGLLELSLTCKLGRLLDGVDT